MRTLFNRKRLSSLDKCFIRNILFEKNKKTFCKALKYSLPLFCCMALLVSCSPTVQVAAPEKPITINLNVKIEHEIKVQVQKDLEDVLNEDSGLF
jgi:YnbE-like lipoprotein